MGVVTAAQRADRSHWTVPGSSNDGAGPGARGGRAATQQMEAGRSDPSTPPGPAAMRWPTSRSSARGSMHRRYVPGVDSTPPPTAGWDRWPRLGRGAGRGGHRRRPAGPAGSAALAGGIGGWRGAGVEDPPERGHIRVGYRGGDNGGAPALGQVVASVLVDPGVAAGPGFGILVAAGLGQARRLVAVDPEDPIARALVVQPPEVGLTVATRTPATTISSATSRSSANDAATRAGGSAVKVHTERDCRPAAPCEPMGLAA